MESNTLLWHDYETFGLKPASDWPAQFAAIRTDMDLNVIGPEVMFHCKPPLDRLPSVMACMITGITPQRCWDQGLPEHRFAQSIFKAMSKPGTIGVGYNSLGFDDEVTRYMFWRNLLPPYEREFRQSCGRWDLLKLVQAACALRPQGMVWPRDENGKISLKLERLTQVNGLSHESAHDALSDVKATVALARLIKKNHPKLWDFSLNLRHKKEVLKQMPAGQPFVHVSQRYGSGEHQVSLAMVVGQHPKNKNEVLVWDLRHDPRRLWELSAAELKEHMTQRWSDAPPGFVPLPVNRVAINRSPFVAADVRVLGAARAAELDIDLDACMRHAQILSGKVPSLSGRWEEVWAPQEAGPAGAGKARVDVDEDLYGQFLGDEDQRRLQQFRELSPGEMAMSRLGFDDDRLMELVFRYRARNFPETLSAPEKERWQKHCLANLESDRPDWIARAQTAQTFEAMVDEMVQNLPEDSFEAHEEQHQLLEALSDWLQTLRAHAHGQLE